MSLEHGKTGTDTSTLIDFQNQDLLGLKSLVNMDDYSVRKIVQNTIETPEKIYLLDFIEQLGINPDTKDKIISIQKKLIPEERKVFLGKFTKAITSTPTFEHNLSLMRVNPFTQFEKSPSLLFGMGGGSRALNKALPIDILSMVLSAEKLRRELDLGRCRVICANDITYTNIPKNSEFSIESIDNVMIGERELLKIVVDKLGIADHWDIFLGTDIEKVIGKDAKKEYDNIILNADNVSFVGGHHYSMEIAEMWSLIGGDIGGIKIGWFMRNLNKVYGGYIMDEQPFDARYFTYLALKGMSNKTSISYVNAGVKIFPGINGDVDKESPYICYDPNNRILLSPFERVNEKLAEAAKVGGGLKLKQVRRQFINIIKLFEDVVLNKDVNNSECNIANSRRRQMDSLMAHEFEDMGADEKIGARLQFVLDYLFSSDRIAAENIWKASFHI